MLQLQLEVLLEICAKALEASGRFGDKHSLLMALEMLKCDALLALPHCACEWLT